MSKDWNPHRPWKPARIYAPKDEAGNLKARPWWYVYYFIKHPVTGAWVMKKVTAKINRFDDLTVRMFEAGKLQSSINELLEKGWNPLRERVAHADLTKCIARYMEDHVSKLKPLTYTTIKASLGYLTRYMDLILSRNILAMNIQRDHITGALNCYFKKEKWSNGQYNNHLARWRTFFNYLMDEGTVDRNPTERIKFLRVIPTDRNRPPTEEEFSRIVNYLYKNDKELFLYAMMIYYQGFRVTATGTVQRSQIEFDTENPFFRSPAKNQKDNEDVIRYVSPYLLQYFYEFGIDKLPQHWYLFSRKLEPGEKQMGKIKDLVEERWRKKIKLQLGIPVDLYAMKHKQAMELGGKVPMHKISAFLGHSTEDVTRVYMKKYKPSVEMEFYQAQRPLPIDKE